MSETAFNHPISGPESALGRSWRLLLFRGVAAIVFGLGALVWAKISVSGLVTLYGAYAIFDGVAALGVALRGGVGRHWWFALVGLISFAAGLAAFAWPAPTTIVAVVSAWSVARGAAEVATWVTLRPLIENEWALVAGGLISVAFGILISAATGAEAAALPWLIANWAVAFGILTIVFAMRVRRLPH